MIYGVAYSAGTIHTYYVVTLAPGIAALSGLLLGLCAPVFLAASWLAERRGRRRADRGLHPPASGHPRCRKSASPVRGAGTG